MYANENSFFKNSWNNFIQNTDDSSAENLLLALENYEGEELTSYPELFHQNVEIKNKVQNNLQKYLSENDDEQKLVLKNKINSDMVLLFQNSYTAIEQTNRAYFYFFIILIVVSVLMLAVLMFLHTKEIKQKETRIAESSDFLKETIKVQEQERTSLSRELHDTVLQDMKYVSFLAEELPKNQISQNLVEKQNMCINEIRNFCLNLEPPEIINNDIIPSLEELCNKIQRESGIVIKLIITDDADFSVFTKNELHNIYRIIQEALRNIQIHSKANEASVLFRKNEIIICDDGNGIDEKTLSILNNENESYKMGRSIRHLGVRNIKQRASLLNAKAFWKSEEGIGTELLISFGEQNGNK